MNGLPVLSILILLPVAGAAVVPFLRGRDAVRWFTLLVLLADFLLAVWILAAFDPASAAMQFREARIWVPALNMGYRLGIDGISVWFVLLTTLLGWICVLASWRAIAERVKEFMTCLLAIQAMMVGVFCALDLVLFYVLWEVMLVPMYLIIGIWGGGNRIYAAFKFFLYTLAGSLLFLVGLLALYFAGGRTFDMLALMAAEYPFRLQVWVFLAFLVAFAVKVPMVPVHTWLPDAHVQAPTAGSIILAGVLLKMGAYGFLRFSLPMLPDASQYLAPLMITLSAAAIVYGGLLALAQNDIKKLIAYSSVSHMGFVTLGLFTFEVNGMSGAVIQMFNHGISTGALFLFVGLIYERTHSREIAAYGGMIKAVPVFGILFAAFLLASMAVPGTNGFIGEILVLAGTFGVSGWAGTAGVLGALIGAAYLLGLYRQMLLGPVKVPEGSVMQDLRHRELACAAPLLLFVFWFGLYPKPFLSILQPSLDHLMTQIVPTGTAQ
ncbi:NADH-quinone oxidoreductase subunit M [Leisingera aquaemixtae]|uniref:NADH-quinone oxidoreductase subunit M n=1 Tax=Leisingera aquaemixtae TaxID=1396826 RepID=UPI001C9718C9|nr:NADH-quinone oxidoreductase subunit M [Leisingera aquaemixtae]MBY6066614.1 NADH-quinone oxidoreductase subunit M [Leisingera aquaemixtae]